MPSKTKPGSFHDLIGTLFLVLLLSSYKNFLRLNICRVNGTQGKPDKIVENLENQRKPRKVHNVTLFLLGN